MCLLHCFFPMEWLAVGIVLLSCIYYYFRTSYSFWKRQGIKYIEPVPPFGNYKDFILAKHSLAELFKKQYDMFPDERYFGTFEMTRPNLVARDPELIKQILIKDFSSFQNRGLTIHEDIDPLSANLILLSNPRWYALRTKLTPAFTTGKMKWMFPLMAECSKEMIKSFDKPASNGEVIEVTELLTNFSIDVIGSCAFGLQINAINSEKSEFRIMAKKIAESSALESLRRTVATAFPLLFKIFHIKLTPSGLTEFFIQLVKETIQYREKHDVSRNDFMDLLIQLKNKGEIESDGMKCTNEEEAIEHKSTFVEFTDTLLTAQTFMFFQAGSDTTYSTIAMCLYELVLNTNIQTKLRDSIQSTIKEYDGEITYEALQNMTYLDNVVDETLRKYPPISFTVREATRPYTLPGTKHVISPGLRIFIPIYGLHHDPRYFPEPDVFNPENFSSEAKSARPKCTFIPFGDGPRNCIGLRFGLLVAKLALAVLLTNFKFSASDKMQVPIILDPKRFNTTARDGVWLKIEKLHPTEAL